MKVKAKRKKKRSSNYDYLNTVKVSNHNFVFFIDEIEDEHISVMWRFENKGKFYGSSVCFKIKPNEILKSTQDAVNRMIEQAILVSTTFGDFDVFEIKGDEFCG